MSFFVEQMVPSEVLLKQGIYLQTCAHIELVAWRIVQMIDGVDPTSLAEIKRYIGIKLNTRDIVARLRKAGAQCDAALGTRIERLADRISSGLSNRNMAAHGAWRLHPEGNMEVEHYLRAKDKELRYISERFSSHDIQIALEDADQILIEAVAIHDALRARGKSIISYTASGGPSSSRSL